MNQCVLVTGGSGFLGINLIRHLRSKGITDIRSIDLMPFDYPEKDQIQAVVGDIRDVVALKQVMQGVTWVIHTAAALPLYSEEDIMTTDVDGTRNVMAVAREAGVERAVMISSTAVYGIPDHHPLVENDPLIGVGPYGRAKILAEEECLKAREQGLCVPIIRPKSFVGPERLGVFALFYDWAYTGHGFPMIGSGRKPLPTSRRGGPLRGDLADAHAGQRQGQRHVQHRRQSVHHHARRLSSRAGCRRARQKIRGLPAKTVIWSATLPRVAAPLAALQVGV